MLYLVYGQTLSGTQRDMLTAHCTQQESQGNSELTQFEATG